VPGLNPERTVYTGQNCPPLTSSVFYIISKKRKTN